jgi:hypothetical protein
MASGIGRLWSWYCRAAKPDARMETITSRPLLLAAVGRASSYANQTMLYLTPMHAKAGIIKSMIANIHAALRAIEDAAEQLKTPDKWTRFLRYVCNQIAGYFPPKPIIGAHIPAG